MRFNERLKTQSPQGKGSTPLPGGEREPGHEVKDEEL